MRTSPGPTRGLCHMSLVDRVREQCLFFMSESVDQETTSCSGWFLLVGIVFWIPSLVLWSRWLDDRKGVQTLKTYANYVKSQVKEENLPARLGSCRKWSLVRMLCVLLVVCWICFAFLYKFNGLLLSVNERSIYKWAVFLFQPARNGKVNAEPQYCENSEVLFSWVRECNIVKKRYTFV